MRSVLLIGLALYVCYALATGTVVGSNGNIPAPGTTGTLTPIPLSWAVTVTGNVVVGTGNPNCFKALTSDPITISSPTGNGTRTNICSSPSYNAIIGIFASTGVATGFVRLYTGTSFNFNNFVGTFVPVAGTEYCTKGGPSCFTFKKREVGQMKDALDQEAKDDKNAAFEEALGKMTETQVIEEYLSRLSENDVVEYIRQNSSPPSDRLRNPAYFILKGFGYTVGI